ncbi:MAG: hypothetical protein ACOYU7_01590 [Bacillota bacterium]
MTWLRWGLVLPAAAAAYFVIQFLTAPLGGIAGFEWVYKILNSIFCPAALILAGAFTAPRRRFLTGVLLAIPGGLVMVEILLSAGVHGFGVVEPVVVGGAALWLVVSAIACWTLRRLERNRRPAQDEVNPHTHITQNTQN